MLSPRKTGCKSVLVELTGIPQKIFLMHRGVLAYPRYPRSEVLVKGRLLLGTSVAALLLSSAIGTNGTVRAQSMFGGAPINGITCDSAEGAVEHVHANLQIFERGRAIEIPANVGIPLSGNCIYWVHTHRPDGVIHIESPVKRNFTLGDFFDIWGPELTWTQAGETRAPRGKRLQIEVNGRPWHGSDPRRIVLRDRQTIVIQTGPPFAVPQKYDWSKL
jgi:hypothetical protein